MSIIATIASAVAIVGTPIGVTFAFRSYQYNKSAPVRQRQEKLRDDLKLRLTQQNRLTQAIKNLDKDLPSSLVNEDLSDLRMCLKMMKDQFNAPTPEQLGVFVQSLDEALQAMAVAQHVPLNDEAFNPNVQEIKGNVLRPALVKVEDQLKVLLTGLTEIEKKPMSVRKQKKLFRELG